MANVKLFYCIKLCDETDCFSQHLAKICKIEKHIKCCFNAHLVRDKLFNYVLSKQATVSEATHMQYLDKEGIIRISSLSSEEPLPGSNIINFRLISLSKWYHLFTDVKPYELDPGAKSFPKAYTNHLIK